METSVMTEGVLDLGPLVEGALALLGVVLSVVAAWIGRWTAKKFDVDTQSRMYLDIFGPGGVLDDAIEWGIKKGKEKGKPLAQIKTDNETVEQVVEFVLMQAPNWLRSLGLGPDRIREIVEARLEKVLGVNDGTPNQ